MKLGVAPENPNSTNKILGYVKLKYSSTVLHDPRVAKPEAELISKRLGQNSKHIFDSSLELFCRTSTFISLSRKEGNK